MISEQVKALRIVGKSYSGWGLAKLLNGAADTIEELGAKLAAANMERSTAYYNQAEVLAKLEELYTTCLCRNTEPCSYPEKIGCCYDKAVTDAIEIVKRGGVDE